MNKTLPTKTIHPNNLPKNQLATTARNFPVDENKIIDDYKIATVARLLEQWNAGSATAWDNVIPLVYQNLHCIAQNICRKKWIGHTLQPTVMIHELYLRFRKNGSVKWQDREHFFAASAKIFRQILVDYARYKFADKRNSNEFDQSILVTSPTELNSKEADFLSLDQGLNKLEEIDSNIYQVVELRYFSGLTVKEVAKVLGLTERTVFRRWSSGKTWLRDYLNS